MSAIDKKALRMDKATKKYEILQKAELIKQIRKIRLETLRKLCFVCYMAFVDNFNITEHEPRVISIEQIMEVLKCHRREAYDYLNTIAFVKSLDWHSNKNFSKLHESLRKITMTK